MTDILLELGIDIKRPISREETLQTIEKLKKISLEDMGIKYTIPQETVQKFMESRAKLKEILADVAPNIDADKFIRILMTSPFKVDSQNFDSIIKLMVSLENYISANTVKNAFADLESSITVNHTQVNITVDDSKKYLQIIMNVIFPVFLAILTQYQTYQTTEQLNRIETEQHQQTEQLNRIESILENYIEQDTHSEYPDFIMDLDKYEDGTRT